MGARDRCRYIGGGEAWWRGWKVQRGERLPRILLLLLHMRRSDDLDLASAVEALQYALG